MGDASEQRTDEQAAAGHRGHGAGSAGSGLHERERQRVSQPGRERQRVRQRDCRPGEGAGPAPTPARPTPTPPGPTVKVAPGNGAKAADPLAGITVTATRGTLASVRVITAQTIAAGSLAADSGNPSGPMPGTSAQEARNGTAPGRSVSPQQYTVTAIATGEGTTKTTTSAFTTLTPPATFSTDIFEGDDQTYGVGMPLILTFSQPITDKAAVERSLQVQTSKPVVGAWYWDTSESLAFRPRSYWPADTTVTFTGHLDGVKGAPGLYGYHTLTQTFTIGQSVIAVASTTSHHTQIYVGGKLTYTWPISTGRPGDDTPNGTYLTIEKENPVRMTGPGYSLLVPWSVRFTWSGDYYHDAYGRSASKALKNVSHGCVNLPPAAAEATTSWPSPATPSRSRTALRQGPRITAGPTGSSPGTSSSGQRDARGRQDGPGREHLRDPATLRRSTSRPRWSRRDRCVGQRSSLLTGIRRMPHQASQPGASRRGTSIAICHICSTWTPPLPSITRAPGRSPPPSPRPGAAVAPSTP